MAPHSKHACHKSLGMLPPSSLAPLHVACRPSHPQNRRLPPLQVDPHSKHAFNSRYDFGPWPLLQNLDTLPPKSLALLHHTRALVANGFVFDELPLGVVQVR